MTNTELMDPAEKFFFEAGYKELTNAVMDVLEKPEFHSPKIQNLLMMELAGGIILNMFEGAQKHGDQATEQAKGLLTQYLMFLIMTIEQGGLETLPKPEKAVVN